MEAFIIIITDFKRITTVEEGLHYLVSPFHDSIDSSAGHMATWHKNYISQSPLQLNVAM